MRFRHFVSSSRTVVLPAIALLLFAWLGCASAQRVESPLELIYAPDNMLVAGRLIEINPTGRIVIERGEVMSGKIKPPAKIDVRVAMDVLPTLKTGERYIVAYSMFRRDPRKAVGLVPNPDGAIVLVNPGIEPAIFRDTPAARAILKAGRSEHGRESRRLADLLIAALSGSDAQLQNLAAGEFAYELELGEQLRDADRAVIEKTARNVKTPLQVRAMLLEGAARQSKTLGAWWQSAALEIVTTTPVDGYADKASDPVALVLTALEVLDRFAIKVPPDALKRWVWNPNPPLVERVCVMLRREAPDQERSTIQLALADPKLPETTRKFLNDHLRRLDRINELKRARKEGSG
jgi:hypothetical protein